jgi:hypothetical protein
LLGILEKCRLTSATELRKKVIAAVSHFSAGRLHAVGNCSGIERWRPRLSLQGL